MDTQDQKHMFRIINMGLAWAPDHRKVSVGNNWHETKGFFGVKTVSEVKHRVQQRTKLKDPTFLSSKNLPHDGGVDTNNIIMVTRKIGYQRIEEIG